MHAVAQALIDRGVIGVAELVTRDSLIGVAMPSLPR